MIEWSIVAGAIALVRRLSLAGAALIAVAWSVSSCCAGVGGASVATFNGGNFFRYLAPAFPAAFLLAISVPLLLPVAGTRGRRRHRDLATERGAAAGPAPALPSSIAPLLPILLLPHQKAPVAAAIPNQSLFVPVDQFALHDSIHDGSVTLSWPAETSGGARVKYEVYRRDPTCSMSRPPHPPRSSARSR